VFALLAEGFSFQMSSSEGWYGERNDRSLRYAGRVLPPDRVVTIKLDRAFGASYDGQVAAIVASNLLSRMTPSLVFDFPEVDIVKPLPWAGTRLGERTCQNAFSADPKGRFELRSARDGDYVLSLGRGGGAVTVHGSGWNAFVGRGPSPVPRSSQTNPFGPALAAVIAVSRLFALQMKPMDGPHVFNALDWRNVMDIESESRAIDLGRDLGAIWTIGAGSVGTAVLYFLTLATSRFSATLFDMDFVKIHNLDRSPIFAASDAEPNPEPRRKVDATASYLRAVGVENVRSEPRALDESSLWFDRQSGTPDIMVSAANERNVRYIVEQSAPPLQIYGTTGANWQASVIRHIPMVDACSCCLFPPEDPQPAMKCATDTVRNEASGETVDASLPFLSFGAGLMAAAEVVKAGLPDYPFAANRTTLYAHPNLTPRFVSVGIRQRPACICAARSASVHKQMIAGTRYERFSLGK
jgi:hypothetical protein